MNLPDQVVVVTRALAAAGVPHAFGGAIALAFCVGEARATVDMDVNVFLPTDRAQVVLDALPPPVDRDVAALELLRRDGQVRLWWDTTPVDLFFNTTDFHEQVALRVGHARFGPVDLPVLACRDLAVFKAFFDRTKDWADLEAMAVAGALDVAATVGVLVQFVGPDDPRVARLLSIEPGRP